MADEALRARGRAAHGDPQAEEEHGRALCRHGDHDWMLMSYSAQDGSGGTLEICSRNRCGARRPDGMLPDLLWIARVGAGQMTLVWGVGDTLSSLGFSPPDSNL